MGKTIDYGAGCSDYQTTMAEDPAEANDYGSITHGKLCPLKERGPLEKMDMRALMDAANGLTPLIACKPPLCGGSDCAWWDADKERCAVLSIARNK